jgi:hypothetical protein
VNLERVEVADAPGNRRRDRIYWVFIALWVLAVVFGMSLLWRYKLRPGNSGLVPESWPKATPLVAANEHTLIMFVHPACPCSRASIGELGVLMSQFQGRLRAYVLMQRPRDYRGDLRETEYWRSAGALRGVKVVADEEGVEMARFGARTSGHTLLFAPDGTLLFSGGITGARGHSGDNMGRTRVATLLERGQPDRPDSPVFGCELDPEKTDGPAGGR